MARKPEFYEGSHGGTSSSERETVETSQDTARSLGAAALPVHDIEHEWGPARRRSDAPTYEVELPESVYSA